MNENFTKACASIMKISSDNLHWKCKLFYTILHCRIPSLILLLLNYVEKCAMVNYVQEFPWLHSENNLPNGKFCSEIYCCFIFAVGKNNAMVNFGHNLSFGKLLSECSQRKFCRNLSGTFEHNLAKVKLGTESYNVKASKSSGDWTSPPSSGTL